MYVHSYVPVCWCAPVSVRACMHVYVHMYISVMADVSVAQHAVRRRRRTSGAVFSLVGGTVSSSVPHTQG